jgi:sulfite reductase (ferredoxin)
MRLTPSQNVLLYEIGEEQKDQIQAILSRCGIKEETAIDPLVRYSMACPALPTCGLAITESERVLPGILERIRALLTQVGLPEEHFIIRMTGCPNGCARPYLAELALVGSQPESYQVWLGAAPNQTRLAQAYMDRMHINDLEKTLEPIFVFFKQSRHPGESFGDFCDRVGLDAIRQFASQYQPENGITAAERPLDGDGKVASKVSLPASQSRHRVGMQPELYQRVKVAADQQGKPVSHLVAEAVEAYLQGLAS